MPSILPDAAILCGGLGSRLRGTLAGLPKAMAPIRGRPFLELLVEALLAAHLERIVLCIGIGADAIRQHFMVRDGGVEIAYSEEPNPLGTGGALGLARTQLRSDPVLVLNGDSIVPGLDFEAFFRFHRQHGAAGSLVVVPQDQRTDTGTIGLDSTGRIQQFAEKTAVAGARFQSAGIYLLGQSLLAMIPPGQPSSLERDLMPLWLETGVYGYLHPGELVDIGTPERLAQAQEPWT